MASSWIIKPLVGTSHTMRRVILERINTSWTTRRVIMKLIQTSVTPSWNVEEWIWTLETIRRVVQKRVGALEALVSVVKKRVGTSKTWLNEFVFIVIPITGETNPVIKERRETGRKEEWKQEKGKEEQKFTIVSTNSNHFIISISNVSTTYINRFYVLKTNYLLYLSIIKRQL